MPLSRQIAYHEDRMMMLHELDEDAYEKAHNQRVDLIQGLYAEGFERWDMYPNGDERFRKGEGFVVVKYNPEIGTFEATKLSDYDLSPTDPHHGGKIWKP